MPKRTRYSYVLTILSATASIGLLQPAETSAAITTYTDGTFSLANWSLITQTINAGGAASASQSPTGGNPGAYRQVGISVNGGTDSEVYGFSLTNAAIYTPSIQSAIISLNYQEDRNTIGAGQEFGPALMQNGILYYYNDGHGATNGWQTASASSLTSSNFGTDTSLTNNPDFSATGGSITFGFVSINNTGLNGSNFNSSAAYDNWSVSIVTVKAAPEPAVIWMVLAGSVLLSRRCAKVTHRACRFTDK